MIAEAGDGGGRRSGKAEEREGVGLRFWLRKNKGLRSLIFLFFFFFV